jgi:predicted transcriptional regulator
VLLPLKVAQGVADGSLTLAFRRWKKQDVRVGQQFVTAAGMVRVEDVTVVDADAITEEEARQAGWPDAERLRKRLNPDESLPTYRVRLSHAGADPRVALRESAELTADDVTELDRRLGRLDRASSHGPWTLAYLELIRAHPQRRAPDLAEIVGRETAPFKIDVRKLKGLGLTVSFPVGYEVSPRGLSYLSSTTRRA